MVTASAAALQEATRVGADVEGELREKRRRPPEVQLRLTWEDDAFGDFGDFGIAVRNDRRDVANGGLE